MCSITWYSMLMVVSWKVGMQYKGRTLFIIAVTFCVHVCLFALAGLPRTLWSAVKTHGIQKSIYDSIFAVAFPHINIYIYIQLARTHRTQYSFMCDSRKFPVFQKLNFPMLHHSHIRCEWIEWMLGWWWKLERDVFPLSNVSVKERERDWKECISNTHQSRKLEYR